MVCRCSQCHGVIEPKNDMRLYFHNGTEGGYLSHTIEIPLDFNEDTGKIEVMAVITELHNAETGKVARQAIFYPQYDAKAMHIAYTYYRRSKTTGQFLPRACVIGGKLDHDERIPKRNKAIA